MIYKHEEYKTLYITEEISAHNLVVFLMRSAGSEWKEWKISFVENVYNFEFDYDIVPNAMINQIDLFKKFSDN